MEEDNSVYEVERVCFDYEGSLKDFLGCERTSTNPAMRG